MVEKPVQHQETVVFDYDGNEELKRLLGIGNINMISEGGWVIMAKNLTDEDLEEFMTGKKISVDEGSAPKVNSLPRPVRANEGSVG